MSNKEELKQRLAMLTALNNEVMNSDKERAFDLKENVVDPAIEAVENAQKALNDKNDEVDRENAKTLDNFTAVLDNAATLENETKTQQEVKDAAVEKLEQEARLLEIDLARKKAVLLKADNYLARWTRMDLFPNITRENTYPRTAMERTQRRDFLAKGTGHIYPFGNKNAHQMTGVGGVSSDIIKLRRLYGRANYFSKGESKFNNEI